MRVRALCFFATVYGLEVMAVEVEWMFAGVCAVEDDFDDLAFFENPGVGVAAVDSDVCCILAGG